MFVEKYVECARHIEVQIFGDGKGAYCDSAREGVQHSAPASEDYRGDALPFCGSVIITSSSGEQFERRMPDVASRPIALCRPADLPAKRQCWMENCACEGYTWTFPDLQ